MLTSLLNTCVWWNPGAEERTQHYWQIVTADLPDYVAYPAAGGMCLHVPT